MAHHMASKDVDDLCVAKVYLELGHPFEFSLTCYYFTLQSTEETCLPSGMRVQADLINKRKKCSEIGRAHV